MTEPVRRPMFRFAYPSPTPADILLMGGMLCGIKAERHGEFIVWVKAECPFSYRTANRYMSAARALLKIDTLAHLDMEQPQ